ncbi:hypothetical protein QUF58_08705 [Anaerolineales bacterium HSG24]|nr:hypothetical protein [Anaerolineales bacterium HSG24]
MFNSEREWLKYHKFKPGYHPFSTPTADKEEDLDWYLTNKLSYFNQLIKPETTFLFAKRGMGKTAYRLVLEKEFSRKNVLIVRCTDFYSLLKKGQVTLTDHIELILREAMTKLFHMLLNGEIDVSLLDSMPDYQLQELAWFTYHYISGAKGGFLNYTIPNKNDVECYTDQEFEDLIVLCYDNKEFHTVYKLLNQQSTKDHIIHLITVLLVTRAWSKGNIEIYEGVISFMARLLQAETDMPQSDTLDFYNNEYSAPKDLMAGFFSLLDNFNIEQICIFVDRVSDYHRNGYTQTPQMLEPLIRAVPILEMNGYVFKFFFPSEIKNELISRFRKDRFLPYELEWEEDDLKRLIAHRLWVATYDNARDSNCKNIKRLFEIDIHHVDFAKDIVEISNGSPRNVVWFLRTIFNIHTKNIPISSHIVRETYFNAIREFIDD